MCGLKLGVQIVCTFASKQARLYLDKGNSYEAEIKTR